MDAPSDCSTDSGSPTGLEVEVTQDRPHSPVQMRVATALIVVVAVVLTTVGYDVLSMAALRPARVVRAPSAQGTSTTASPSATTTPGQLQKEPVLGISVPSAAALDRFVDVTGTNPEVVNTFDPWSRDQPLDRRFADAVVGHHARLMITWEPWVRPGRQPSRPVYSLASIARGDHDAYVDMYAASIKRYRRPVIIRLMHEMNGNWYPWGTGASGYQPDQFVLAWKHVHDRFTALGVTNAQWMWAPNAVYDGSAPLAPLYPGDDYVDLVGVSNYNWGEQVHDHYETHWQTFDVLFDQTLGVLRSMTSRPLWIAEVGSSDEGGSKAAWITATLDELQVRSDVEGFVWFDHVDRRRGVDWRIETQADASAAWRDAYSSRRAVPTAPAEAS